MEWDKPLEGAGEPREGFEHLLLCARLLGWAADMLSRFSDRRGEWAPLFVEGWQELQRLERAGYVPPLAHVCDRFNLNDFGRLCLMLGAAFEVDPKVKRASQSLTGAHLPGFDLVIEMYSLLHAPDSAVYAALPPARPLGDLLISYSSETFGLCPQVRAYLLEMPPPSHPYLLFGGGVKDFPETYSEQTAQGSRMLQSALSGGKELCLAAICAPGAGGRAFAKRVCAALGLDCLIIIPPEDAAHWNALASAARCLCALHRLVPVVDTLGAAVDTHRFIELLPPELKVMVLLCAKLPADARALAAIGLPDISFAGRERLWKTLAGGLDIDPGIMAARYKLAPERIESVLCAVQNKKSALVRHDTDDAALVYREISMQNVESELARLMRPVFTLDDILCDENTMRLLRRICEEASIRPRLLDLPEYGGLFPYGRGIGVLFHGTPGTGKTMAAHALARELGLDIMIVDLSMLMDKYIGETEKRMTKVFNTARGNNCVLFFDEADSLFAKRTEVKDAHDRHANTMTAHLLQKIEHYDGIAVLSTNLMDNIDDAFRRRLPFIVPFGKPDAATRRELWQRFIPKRSRGEGLDFEYLGELFDLSPAVIKSAALSAAVRAEGCGSKIMMIHVIEGLKYEYDKMGLSFPERDYDNLIL